MKHYNNIFYIFFYEAICMLLFTTVLSFLDDRNTGLFFRIGIISVIITLILGAIGYLFKLFRKEDLYEES